MKRRHYFELCVLWELQGALRAGDVWLEGSRRYADPETYLIPRERWPGLRAEVCREVQAPEDGTDRLCEREKELSGLLDRVEGLLAKGGDVRIDGDDLVVSPLEAGQTLESTAELERLIDERLPEVDLPELLIEVDGWTGLTDHLVPLSGNRRRGRPTCRACSTRRSSRRQRISGSPAWRAPAISATSSSSGPGSRLCREDTLTAASASLVDYPPRSAASLDSGRGPDVLL